MLRKGREVHKIYVEVHKGLSFLDDRFTLTEFGRMVLESGSVRAGRARNVRQIVVARETLYCSGTTGCMRGCGGHGQCLPGHIISGATCRLWLLPTAASVFPTSQPQLSSLDLSVKTDPESAATGTPTEDTSNDSPMELTTKVSAASAPNRNGHFPSPHSGESAWSERNELLKSYVKVGSPSKNGVGSSNGGSGVVKKELQVQGGTGGKYWTYQFSTPDISPANSPTQDENGADNETDHDLENGCLVIDEERCSMEREETPDDEEDDKYVGYNTRHVALKVAYLGWDYQGFVVQEDTDKTIEAALFDCLLKTRLIESRETSNYHRCGRTDKGVSAFGQVISIDLRTNLLKGPGVKVREGGTAHLRQGETTTEIRYVHILNKVLPPEIRILAWAPVEESFSARFSCKKRTYKYYFPKGNLDLQLMSEAASKLVGEHDFRNLCKMDVGNGVTSFKRRILRTEVIVLDNTENGSTMCELTVVGQAFLWHQIRCIVAVLFLIAQGKEEPDILDDLLNVEKCPRKPQYSMASELPLVLFDCDFGDDLEWVYEADWHEDNIRHLQQMWAQHAIRATMLKRMLEELDQAKVETESDIAPWNELSAPVLQQCEWIIPGNKPRVYKPLLSRQTCESLEERIEHYAKRRKTSHPQSTSSASAASAPTTAT
nr:hypothetical protein BaRGS_021501 [Batillaria attramentaria]